MKIVIKLFLSFLFQYQICLAQVAFNNITFDQDANVQQITSIISNDIIGSQSLNNERDDLMWVKQTGDYNKTSINQRKDQRLGKNNQTYTLQNGVGNEISFDQTGNGNLLFSLQLGYLSINAGNRNKISAIQEGDNNGLLAGQFGDDNSISAEQKGMNNNLLILQRGTNNSVTNLSQENASENILYDTIIQNGDNLSLTTTSIPRTTANKNSFEQTGVNLSLTIDNQFLNSTGGIEVNQTGHDMKVIVNQSYFPTQ